MVRPHLLFKSLQKPRKFLFLIGWCWEDGPKYPVPQKDPQFSHVRNPLLPTCLPVLTEEQQGVQISASFQASCQTQVRTQYGRNYPSLDSPVSPSIAATKHFFYKKLESISSGRELKVLLEKGSPAFGRKHGGCPRQTSGFRHLRSKRLIHLQAYSSRTTIHQRWPKC